MKIKLIISLLIFLFVFGLGGCASIQFKNEALIFYQQGQRAFEENKYVEAYEFFKQSLKNYQFFNNDKGIVANHIMMGDIHQTLGTYQEALRSYGDALEIYKKLEIQEGVATTLSRLGRVYESLGWYDKGIGCYEEALKIYRKMGSAEGVATNLTSMGITYQLLGRYENALNYHIEALRIYEKLNIPQDIATGFNNIGGVYQNIGDYEKALEYYMKALKIRKELGISDDIYISLGNIGSCYLSQKRYREAAEMFLEQEKIKGTIIKGNSGLVDVCLATGMYDNAIFLLNEVMPIRWNARDSYRIRYHTQYGIALKGVGKLKNASAELLKAITITEEMRHRVKDKAGFLGARDRSRSYKGLVSTLAERVLNGEQFDNLFIPYGKDLSSAAFYFSESTKARTLLEAMAESARKSQKVELPEELREKEQSILNQFSAIENQWDDAYKRGEDVLRRLKDRKDGLNAKLNNLINELRQKYPRYASLYYPRPIPPEDLPLKEDEVLLEYAIGDDAGYLFVVRKGGVKNLIKIPLTKEDLEAKVKSFIEPMNTRQHERFSVKEAKVLYKILLSEALRDIKENEKVIIVPDGILGLLPFEALVIKEDRDIKESLYVGDRYQISYYQSATVLALQRNLKERKTERPLFALANPIYTKEDPRYVTWKENKKATMVAGLDKYSFRGVAIKAKWGKTTGADTTGKEIEFPPLPETEIEVKEIAKMMNVSPEPPDVLLSARANETELRKTGLERYKYIHFATHASLPGMIQGLNEPFILLGQVENESKDDGFLTLSEVLDLRLNANMVVLSACVTGVGKEVEGEGVANFARAFQHAGAKSVVVSLWEVASEPAVEYMKKFYEYLQAGKSRGDALRLARNEIKTKYPNPFYWAVFILHGEG